MNARSASNSVALKGRDIVVFSNDWDGDPLSKVHIMRCISKDNRILWVNSLGNRQPRANWHDAKRIGKKLKTFTQGIREVEPNIFVMTPLALPFYGNEWVRRFNGLWVRAQVLRSMRKLDFRRVISWSFLPSSAPISGALGEEFVIYHCVDEFSAFADTEGRHIESLERRLLRKADLCITSAEKLFESKKALHSQTVLVRHGVDFQHFYKACESGLSVPSDLASLPKPVIGFFGLIADWVDLDAIEACAKAFPKGSIVLLGKVAPGIDLSRFSAYPNIHFLGRKPYGQLPAYCRGFDVALMPFRLNKLTENANPLKVREYLAAGLPVVSTDLPEVRRLNLCRLASSAQEFPQLVREALNSEPGCNRLRAEKVASESWGARVEDIRLLVGQEMKRRGLPL